ncbi:MAG: tetratricopeptide repeat protein [Planctomycetes bacterium]|nr:tetratricopeptide repeat protein [Planctomycetota bacterium]
MKPTTLKVLLGTMAITGLMVLGAYLHYAKINASEDPRVAQSKKNMHYLSKLLEERDYPQCFQLLKTIEADLSSLEAYEKSYEMGVVHNDRASIHLIQVEEAILISSDAGKIPEKAILEASLNQALESSQKSIAIYETWQEQYQDKSLEELEKEFIDYFPKDDPALVDRDIEAILKRRVVDTKMALKENHRRVSVAYTNLALAYKYKGNYDEAVAFYEKALELWPENLHATNNLRTLQGQKRIERSIIDKVFPPERNKGL